MQFVAKEDYTESYEVETSTGELMDTLDRDWDFQKGWPVFEGYYDSPELYCSTGAFALAGFPYDEPIEWACCRAEQQDIDVLFHVSFKTEFDLSKVGISADYSLVKKDEMLYKQYHTDLSISDMIRLSALLDEVHFTLCNCGATAENENTVNLWWKLPN